MELLGKLFGALWLGVMLLLHFFWIGAGLYFAFVILRAIYQFIS